MCYITGFAIIIIVYGILEFIEFAGYKTNCKGGSKLHVRNITKVLLMLTCCIPVINIITLAVIILYSLSTYKFKIDPDFKSNNKIVNWLFK